MKIHPLFWSDVQHSVCQLCQARKWKGESPGMCCFALKWNCQNLNILQSHWEDYSHGHPENLDICFRMFANITELSKWLPLEWRKLPYPGDMPTFNVCGQVYRRGGSFRPLPNEDPNFCKSISWEIITNKLDSAAIISKILEKISCSIFKLCSRKKKTNMGKALKWRLSKWPVKN